MNLKSGGATSFSNLTLTAGQQVLHRGGDNPATADYWLDTVAIVLDGQVICAPVRQPVDHRQRRDHRQLHPGRGHRPRQRAQFGALPLSFDSRLTHGLPAARWPPSCTPA